MLPIIDVALVLLSSCLHVCGNAIDDRKICAGFDLNSYKFFEIRSDPTGMGNLGFPPGSEFRQFDSYATYYVYLLR